MLVYVQHYLHKVHVQHYVHKAYVLSGQMLQCRPRALPKAIHIQGTSLLEQLNSMTATVCVSTRNFVVVVL